MTRGNKATELLDTIHGCSSWEDIQRKLGHLSEKQKGDLFEELVKAYLLLEPEYASKLRHIWLHREVPRAVAEKLKLPATNEEILMRIAELEESVRREPARVRAE